MILLWIAVRYFLPPINKALTNRQRRFASPSRPRTPRGPKPRGRPATSRTKVLAEPANRPAYRGQRAGHLGSLKAESGGRAQAEFDRILAPPRTKSTRLVSAPWRGVSAHRRNRLRLVDKIVGRCKVDQLHARRPRARGRGRLRRRGVERGDPLSCFPSSKDSPTPSWAARSRRPESGRRRPGAWSPRSLVAATSAPF